jgi:hypothetical protein
MLDGVWTTKDGQQYNVSAMETSHIRNCVAKIERSKTGWRREWLERLLLELEIRAMGKTSKRVG